MAPMTLIVGIDTSCDDTGVGIVRVSPQSSDTAQVLRTLRGACDGLLSGYDACKALAACAPGKLWNGFWHGRAGMEAA